MNRKHPLVEGPAVLLGHGLFLFLLFLSWWHWDLRIAHVDTAYQVFSWLNDPAYKIEAHRYSAIVPQALIKAGAGLGLGTRTLLIVASVAHVLVPYLIFVTGVHVLRSLVVAMAMPLATVLCMHTSFYGMVLEAHYLLSYPFLVLAFWEWAFNKGVGRRPWTLAVGLVLLIPTLMVHPTAFAFVLFMALFAFLLPGRSWPLPVSAMLVCLLWAMNYRTWFPPSAYELEFSTNLRNGLTDLGRIPELVSTGYFLDGLLLPGKFYILPVVLLLLGVMALLRSRHYLHAAFAAAAFPAYLVVTFLSSPYGQQEIMMDKSIMPSALLAVLPWVLGHAGEAHGRRSAALMTAILVIVLVVKSGAIATAAARYEDRLAGLQQVVQDGRSSGGGVRYFTAPDQAAYGLVGDWGVPFETLLISASDGGAPVMMLPCEPIPEGTAWEQLPFWLQDMHYPMDRDRFGVDIDPASLHAIPVFRASGEAPALTQ